jgi:hypothetical protein
MVSLADFLVLLRERLIDSLEKEDKGELRRLTTTFGILTELSYSLDNRELSGILAELAYSAQHGSMGVIFKAKEYIPSSETIVLACSEARSE